MTTLALAVDTDDELWTLDDLPTPEAPYVEVGSELVEVRSRFPSQTYTLTGQELPPRIRVRRGIAGTTKASHVQGSTLTPNYGLGSSGGGGGAIAVTGGGTTVSDVTEIDLGAAIVTDEGGGVAGVSLNMRTISIPLAFNTPDFDGDGFVATSLAEGEVLIEILLFTTTEWDDGSLEVTLREVGGPTGTDVMAGNLWGFVPSNWPGQVAHMVMFDPAALTLNTSPAPPFYATGPIELLVSQTGSAPTTGASFFVLTVAVTEPA